MTLYARWSKEVSHVRRKTIERPKTSPSKLSGCHPGNDFFCRSFDEIFAETEFRQLPSKNVAELRFLVDTKLVLLLIAHRADGQAFQYHLDLVLRPVILSGLRSRRKTPRQVICQPCRKLIQLLGIKKLPKCHDSSSFMRCIVLLAGDQTFNHSLPSSATSTSISSGIASSAETLCPSKISVSRAL